uniref:Uncharacterized protein n=1 Tax=Bionectria ochroleuca TaxID=29856 RepID=A0A8H7TPY0_BIOOC
MEEASSDLARASILVFQQDKRFLKHATCRPRYRSPVWRTISQQNGVELENYAPWQALAGLGWIVAALCDDTTDASCQPPRPHVDSRPHLAGPLQPLCRKWLLSTTPSNPIRSISRHSTQGPPTASAEVTTLLR